jgi:hypothetical protein
VAGCKFSLLANMNAGVFNLVKLSASALRVLFQKREKRAVSALRALNFFIERK